MQRIKSNRNRKLQLNAKLREEKQKKTKINGWSLSLKHDTLWNKNKK